MTTERDEKEDKEMTDIKKIRRAHKVLDHLGKHTVLSEEQENLLRSFLPELPKQKTLDELAGYVYDAWIGTEDNEWPDDIHGALEAWLFELHAQMQGLAPAAPPRPEFLETEADYENAPEGTIVAHAKNLPCSKYRSQWSSVGFFAIKDDRGMSRTRRQVLRWGWGNE